MVLRHQNEAPAAPASGPFSLRYRVSIVVVRTGIRRRSV